MLVSEIEDDNIVNCLDKIYSVSWDTGSLLSVLMKLKYGDTYEDQSATTQRKIIMNDRSVV